LLTVWRTANKSANRQWKTCDRACEVGIGKLISVKAFHEGDIEELWLCCGDVYIVNFCA